MKDLTGKKFNRLTVISFSHLIKKGYRYYWNCICDCGNKVIARGDGLHNGDYQSCGCYQKEQVAKALRKTATKHGFAPRGHPTREYKTWAQMKNRCSNPKAHNFSLYGGRGIRVCDRWFNSFETFFQDMGFCPSQKHSIERIDTNGDYHPENCKWATAIEQANNTRRNRFLEFQGRKMTIAQWSRETGIAYANIYHRINHGWSIRHALTTP